jgi:hypothetical protein
VHAAEANANRLAELEAQIDALPDTPEANRLRDAFEQFKEQFEPGAADAPQRLDEVQRLIEEQTPEPGTAGEEPDIWDQTAEQKAAKGDAAETLEANRIRGSDAEQSVIVDVVDGKVIPEVGTTCRLRGTQVEIRVAPTNELRIIDVVVELSDGEVVALEVKSGGAERNTRQVRLDTAMEGGGGNVIASDEGAFPTGPHGPIRTIVVRR